ncbi:MAG: hypothetical protein EZS28_004472 [Streblomastix strix]|uniref:Uncharacterized protein n=1 Tax=Streblomastix strix TaxID=222440 RepID=A0A5J4WZT2_9EUKA|nr:MAG: hypothetical protein EZS28_004472 [Streblomastix strix]
MSCLSLWVGHLKTKNAKMNANQDYSKNVRQFSELGTLQTHTQGTNSNPAVDLLFAQLNIDVFQSDQQLTPTITTNALILHTALLQLVLGQLVQILQGITGASLQKTDFYATNLSNMQFFGGNTMCSTSYSAQTTQGDTSSRSTTLAATSDDRRARFMIIIACAVFLGA